MDRRTFVKLLGGGFAAAALASLAGCVGLVSPTVESKKGEQPWRCSYCGHLLRATEDQSQKRCPKCFRKDLGKITEEELQKYLKAAAGK